MKERKAWKECPDEGVEKQVIGRLERMLEDSKILCQEEDPILLGQMQIVLGILADILEAKHPHHHFRHVVEYE